MTDVSSDLPGEDGPDLLAEWRDGTTTLYRMYAAGGELLYVGISRTPVKRVGQEHRATKPWWIDVATVTMEHFDDRETAARAEVLAIQTERPQWNIRSSSDAVRRGVDRKLDEDPPAEPVLAPAEVERRAVVLAAHLALANDRWTRARADAAALIVRRAYYARKDGGVARPQEDLATKLGTLQQGVSRSVKRGDAVANDKDRLRDAHAVAAAAGIDPELLS